MALYKKWSNMYEETPSESAPQKTYKVMQIQNREHRENLIKKNVLLCIDVYTEWCEPCQKIEPLFAQMAEKYVGKCVMVKENADNSMTDLKKYGLNAVPTFLLFFMGHLVNKFEGAGNLPMIEKRIDELFYQYQQPENGLN